MSYCASLCLCDLTLNLKLYLTITCVTVSYCVCAQLIGAGEEGVKEKDPFICQCFGTGDLL